MRIRFCIAAALVALFGLSASAQADPSPSASVTATVSVGASSAVGASTVNVPAGGAIPSGSVTYFVYTGADCPAGPAIWSNTQTLASDGSVPDSAATEALTAGDYALDATYSGDTNYATTTSDCVPFTVAAQPPPAPQPQPVSVTASATPTSATYGNTIIVAAAGLPIGAGGTVTFTAAGSELCQASVTSGGASCTTPVLAPGDYTVTAAYDGDAGDEPATGTTAFTITPAPITASPGPGTTTATTTAAFHFIIPPSITVTRPVNDARYTRDESVRASYNCRDGSDAPGLTSCRGTVAPGATIDTSRTGTHTFTVTGTSKSGESTLRTLHYIVALPSNRMAVRQPILRNDGSGAVSVHVPGPGTLTAVETAWPDDRPEPAASRQTVLSRGGATARRAGTVTVKTVLAATGRRLLGRSHGAHLRVRLVLAYTPTGGVARRTSKYGVLAIR